MRYDEYTSRGIQIGLGVVESLGRQLVGSRLTTGRSSVPIASLPSSHACATTAGRASLTGRQTWPRQHERLVLKCQIGVFRCIWGQANRVRCSANLQRTAPTRRGFSRTFIRRRNEPLRTSWLPISISLETGIVFHKTALFQRSKKSLQFERNWKGQMQRSSVLPKDCASAGSKWNGTTGR